MSRGGPESIMKLEKVREEEDRIISTRRFGSPSSPVSSQFREKHQQMIGRENTLTPEEFEQYIQANLKSNETDQNVTTHQSFRKYYGEESMDQRGEHLLERNVSNSEVKLDH